MVFSHLSFSFKKWIALAGLTCGVSMLFLDSTVLPVATPNIQESLLISNSGIIWVINAYFLATATLVLAAGKIADMVGYRRIFSFGMFIFAFASALGGLATSGFWLIIARFCQGIGGAMMGPASWSIILDIFPVKERGKALGFLIGVSSIFLSLGPSIGGFITEYLSWHWIFWVNVPIAALGIFLVLSSVPKTDLSEESFDIPGFITFSGGVACLVIALMQGRQWGWTSPVIITLFVGSVVFFFLLYVTDRYAKHPFIDFKLYKDHIYFGGSAIVFLVQFLVMISIFWPIFFQKALHFTPLEAGSFTLLSTIPVIFVGPFSGWLHDRFGPKLPILTGFFLCTVAFAWFAFFLQKGSAAYLIPGLFLLGMSLALVMTPNSTSALSTLPQRKKGLGSGMFYSARFTGATLGLALFGALITNLRHSIFAKDLASNPATAELDPHIFWGLLVDSPTVEALINTLPFETKLLVSKVFLQSYEKAFTYAHLFAAVVSVVAFFIAYRTYRNYVKPSQ
ncbi:MAG: MFS transporter [Chlamydiales bacterium]|nr:MFS transporter [Chlamydiales bacterium]